MIKINLLLVFLFLLPNFVFSQHISDYSLVKTTTGEIKIPGKWKQLNTMDDSGQTYLKNKDEVIIAIAQNPMKSYPFFKNSLSDFENVKEFYKWDSDYRKENNFKTEKIKEDVKFEYIIWKYADEKSDNVFLFASKKNNFLNFLVYTNFWNENDKVKFLENLFNLNR